MNFHNYCEIFIKIPIFIKNPRNILCSSFNKVPIKWQVLTVAATLSIVVIPILAGILLVMDLCHQNRRIDEISHDKINLITQLAADSLISGNRTELQLIVEKFRQSDPKLAAITISDPEGKTLASSIHASGQHLIMKSGSIDNIAIVNVIWDSRRIYSPWLAGSLRTFLFFIGASWLLVAAGLIFIQQRILKPLAILDQRNPTKSRQTDEDDHSFPAPELSNLNSQVHWVNTIQKEKETAEAQLGEARVAVEAAEHTGRARMDFLSRMSHEIRTPLGAMLGFVRLLKPAKLNREEQEYLETIDSSGEFLMRILNDILDLSKIEAGGVELEESPFQLSNLSSDVTKMMHSVIEEKEVELISDCSPLKGKAVLGDQHRLKQILMNLIGNAIKFTEQGTIYFRIRKINRYTTGKGCERAVVRFEVEDTGIGMSAQQLEKIFDPFTQAQAEVSRRYGGTGLGLSIARQFVEAMGGQLQVTSEPGVGSCFFFELDLVLSDHLETSPITEPDQIPAVISGNSEKPTIKILVAEDEAINRLLITKYFAILGHTVEFAVDGKDCIERLSSGDRFDAIFLDLHMPYFNGNEIAQKISSGEFGEQIQNTRLAIMSADVLADQEGQLQIDAFITKPIDLDEVRQFLDSPAGLKPEVTTKASHEINILVVEDQAVNRQLIGQVFSTFGFKANFANDGIECIEYLATQPKPDLIFLDLRMPRMDGWTVARKIRSGEAGSNFSDIPIAVVSAEIHSEQTCRDIGVNEFIPKPYDVNRIRKFVEKVQEDNAVALSN